MAKITSCNGYSDENGNRVIGSFKNCDVIFLGKNSTLKIGDNFTAENMTIRINNDCNIEIGSDVTSNGSLWNFYDNADCFIGNNCHFGDNGFLSVCTHAKMFISQGFTIEFDYIMIALPHSEIRFGEDCMVSRRVSVQSNDGHDIFDVKTGLNINATVELSKTKKIIIGNHVWIGQDAMILYNTNIGDGSIVGAKSLVKGIFPNNCVVGGIPAKLLKIDIAWRRGYGDTDIGVIDKRFVRFTEVNDDAN